MRQLHLSSVWAADQTLHVLAFALSAACACSSSDGTASPAANGASAGTASTGTTATAGMTMTAGVSAAGAAGSAGGSRGSAGGTVVAPSAGSDGAAAIGGAGAGGSGAGTAAGGGGLSAAGAAAVAGAGGLTGSAGAGGTAAAGEDACGAIPTGPKVAATPKAVVMHALVEYHTQQTNEFIGVHGTLVVPAKPPPSGVIFAWPGTQAFPDSKTLGAVGEGVLQPVLTWGQSCVPGALPGHDTWWISPVYVNDATTLPDLAGCHGGPVIRVDVGDRLDLDMQLHGTTWDQKVLDSNSSKSTAFSIDLRGEQQQRVIFEIELKSSTKPTEDLIFENVVLTMKTPEPGACVLNNRGMTDYASNSRVSADGTHCCIERIILRADGVPASTQDP